jgi:hypothetical protein
MTIARRLTAAGFVLGSTVHLIALAVSAGGIMWYGADYPWWRHVVMASIDLVVAWIVTRRGSLAVPVLLAFAAEQFLVNGVTLTGVLVAIAAAAVAGGDSAVNRRRSARR